MALHWTIIAAVGALIVLEGMYQAGAFLRKHDKRRQ